MKRDDTPIRDAAAEVSEAELAAVDAALGGLGGLEPPRATVARTLERVREAQDARGSARRWGYGLLAAAGLLAVVGGLVVGKEREPAHGGSAGASRGPSAAEPPASVAQLAQEAEETKPPAPRFRAGGEAGQGAAGGGLWETSTAEVDLPDNDRQWAAFDGDATGAGLATGEDAAKLDELTRTLDGRATANDLGGINGLGDDLGRVVEDRLGWVGSYRGAEEAGRQLNLEGVVAAAGGKYAQRPTTEAAEASPDDLSERRSDQPAPPRVADNQRAPGYLARGAVAQETEKTEAPALVPEAPLPPRPPLDALPFIAARGYFANTYHPGDGALAWLREAVMGGIVRDGQRLRLDELAAPVRQPFDRPRDAALAVVLASDTPAVDGPARVTLQVGLAAAEQAPTRRSPLNLAVVVDVAGLAGDDERRALWAAAEAVARARQEGDRLVFVATTVAGPRVLDDAAAMGPSAVTRFLAEAWEGRGQAADLSTAVARAYAAVRAATRPDSPIGEDAVLLVTPRALDDAAVGALLDVAHAQAIAGVHLSTLGVGARVDGRELTALAAAGQGRRHVAARPDEARQVVGDELAAAGRAVARAVRLRIRLAEGVKLVAVIGSRPLDARDADKVRAAEQAIDQRVAATTGIASDRGADEDGIQIVIPAFLAGDDHVILLDVVVPGPGPVLDVRARFKDLVTMGNGEASASLALTSGRAPLSAGNLNVSRNLATQQASVALAEAAAAVRRGEAGAAARAVQEAKAEVARIAATVTGLQTDPSVQGDLALLRAYAGLLDEAAGWIHDPALTTRIASSLALAARIGMGAGGP